MCVAIHTGDWKGYIKSQCVTAFATLVGGPIGAEIGGSIGGSLGATIGSAVGNAAVAALITGANAVESIAQAAVFAYLQHTFTHSTNPSGSPGSKQTLGEQHIQEIYETRGDLLIEPISINLNFGAKVETTTLDAEFIGPMLMPEHPVEFTIELTCSIEPAGIGLTDLGLNILDELSPIGGLAEGVRRGQQHSLQGHRANRDHIDAIYEGRITPGMKGSTHYGSAQGTVAAANELRKGGISDALSYGVGKVGPKIVPRKWWKPWTWFQTGRKVNRCVQKTIQENKKP